jgi:hypothetical protein
LPSSGLMRQKEDAIGYIGLAVEVTRGV